MTAPWRNPSSWHTWTNREINGQIVTFGHLMPFNLTIHRPANDRFPDALNISVRVIFDTHVVTDKADNITKSGRPLPSGESTWSDAGGNIRHFCSDRYARSFALVNFIASLPGGNIPCYFQSAKSNYLVWQPLANSNSHYQVFFDLYHDPRDGCALVMYVQSAFVRIKPREDDRKNRKVFVQVCATLAK